MESFRKIDSSVMPEAKPIRKPKVLKPHTCPAVVRWANELELSALYQARFNPEQAARVLELLITHLGARRDRLLRRST
jgi:hypothetical protein